MNDLQNSAYADGFTGPVPNNAYGYGKAHALNTLLEQVIPTTPTVVVNIGNSSLDAFPGSYFEWYLDDDILTGENSETLPITPPYGTYYVEVFNSDGCSSKSNEVFITANVNQNDLFNLDVYPNPSDANIQILVEEHINKAEIIDLKGNRVELKRNIGNNYSLVGIAQGAYTCLLYTSPSPRD